MLRGWSLAFALLAAASAARAGPALDAATATRRLRGERQGSLLLRAGAQSTRLRASRKPTRDASERISRLLQSATYEAAERPERAERLLDAAERLGARTGAGVDRGLAHEIRASIAHFKTHARPLLASSKLAGRSPSPADLAHAIEYAHEYVRLQQRYNGGMPNETLLPEAPPSSPAPEPSKGGRLLARLQAKRGGEAQSSRPAPGRLAKAAEQGRMPHWDIDPRATNEELVRGQVPYWDLDPTTPGVEIVGRADESPYLTASGKIRVYSHYLNRAEHARLAQRFGRPPDGRIHAQMSSSYRTLVLFPEGEVPFQLKFSGPNETKTLRAEQVEASIEKSLHLEGETAVVPEPAGLILNGEQGLSIFRPIAMPREGLRPGDRLMPWQVMMDPAFRKTELAKRILERYPNPRAWFEKEAAPAFAEIIYDSLFRLHDHFTLHSQNVEALFDGQGRLRRLFVKDLLDVVTDPAAEAVARGRAPEAAAVRRAQQWGHIGESGDHFQEIDLHSFYDLFFGQIGMYPAPLGMTGDEESPRMIADALIKLVKARVPLRDLERFPEYKAVLVEGASKHPIGVIAGLRHLLLKQRLTDGFRPDAQARSRFFAGEGRLVSSSRNEANWFKPDDPALEYGLIGEVPVAVKRAGGIVTSYYFRFP
jgi:hypothetical protein